MEVKPNVLLRLATAPSLNQTGRLFLTRWEGLPVYIFTIRSIYTAFTSLCACVHSVKELQGVPGLYVDIFFVCMKD